MYDWTLKGEKKNFSCLKESTCLIFRHVQLCGYSAGAVAQRNSAVGKRTRRGRSWVEIFWDSCFGWKRDGAPQKQWTKYKWKSYGPRNLWKEKGLLLSGSSGAPLHPIVPSILLLSSPDYHFISLCYRDVHACVFLNRKCVCLGWAICFYCTCMREHLEASWHRFQGPGLLALFDVPELRFHSCEELGMATRVRKANNPIG